MYKVFVNDIPIILSTEENIGKEYASFPIKEADLDDLIKKIKKGKLFYVNLYHKKEAKLIKHLRKKLKPIIAAGGVVYNNKKEILFIFKKGRWDLPKGKADDGEKLEWTAMRETEEETGVKNLKVNRFLQVTYHIVKENGKNRLKETHWFEMQTDYEGKLTPSLEEGITKAKWKNFEKTQKALRKSYENIKLLFPKEYLIMHPLDRKV